MASSSDSKCFAPVLTKDHGLNAAFGSQQENERLRILRDCLHRIRSSWAEDDFYDSLRHKLRSWTYQQEHLLSVSTQFGKLLDVFNDYADMGRVRQQVAHVTQSPALELCCSEDGYSRLSKPVSNVLRSISPSDEELYAAVTLVEFPTIKLHNIRLANIGDSRCANHEGVVYQGMGSRQSMQRNFGMTTKMLISLDASSLCLSTSCLAHLIQRLCLTLRRGTRRNIQNRCTGRSVFTARICGYSTCISASIPKP